MMHHDDYPPVGRKKSLGVVFLCAALMWLAAAERLLAQDWTRLRQNMLAEIRADVIATRAYIGKRALRPEVFAALDQEEGEGEQWHESGPSEAKSGS